MPGRRRQMARNSRAVARDRIYCPAIDGAASVAAATNGQAPWPHSAHRPRSALWHPAQGPACRNRAGGARVVPFAAHLLCRIFELVLNIPGSVGRKSEKLRRLVTRTGCTPESQGEGKARTIQRLSGSGRACPSFGSILDRARSRGRRSTHRCLRRRWLLSGVLSAAIDACCSPRTLWKLVRCKSIALVDRSASRNRLMFEPLGPSPRGNAAGRVCGKRSQPLSPLKSPQPHQPRSGSARRQRPGRLGPPS